MQNYITEEEEIEGLGDPDSSTWGDYPIDTLLIRNDQRTIHDVLRRIKQNQFVMDPDFQRDFIWDDAKQSKLIESVLMRIPLPVFYLAEDSQGRMVVVDGLQRLSTFRRFVNNELRLRLPDREALDRKKFDDLTPKLQNRIEDCNLILYVIDAKVPEQARLDIFERVNGGVPLTRQQMRNCLYMGEATRFLKTESGTPLFLEATGKSLRSSTMRDREFLNRFCAFQTLEINSYRDMDEFLAECLKRMNAETEILSGLSKQLETTLHNNYQLFGKHAFRKHVPEQEHRNVLNASLWDVMTTGLSRFSREIVRANAGELKEGFYRLLRDEGFEYSITYSPNSVKQVKHRFEMVNKMLEEVFGAHSA
ncbi:MAG: DUF262 domain-containing protein [Chloroflexota bacterium]|nr:DUF262 domain-containing protein [Chloroflexota bacterium]MDE2930062.1 DUF262 domain-containing protein [Chloroflexota bacterium]